jgi:hypothetical protein
MIVAVEGVTVMLVRVIPAVKVAVTVQLAVTVPLVVFPETVPPQPSVRFVRVLPVPAVAEQE